MARRVGVAPLILIETGPHAHPTPIPRAGLAPGQPLRLAWWYEMITYRLDRVENGVNVYRRSDD